jgi:hypothetical protein
MAITINPLTSVINIPQADLTFLSGTLYELDTDVFRLALKGIEDDQGGITFLKTHTHNTEVTIAGVVYARLVSILAPYSVTFEDGQYTVLLKGSNNDIWDVASGILNQNQVQVIPSNSAGLQTVVSGSGVTAQDIIDIVDGVWDEAASGHTTTGTFGKIMDIINKGVGFLKVK